MTLKPVLNDRLKEGAREKLEKLEDGIGGEGRREERRGKQGGKVGK
jgi:hypothetical protein